MTLEELRASLKVLDLAVTRLERQDPKMADMHDAVSDLSEYLLKQHSKIDRLQSVVARLDAELTRLRSIR